MVIRKIYVALLFLFGMYTLHAQNVSVSGKVLDEKGVPIPAASVFLKGTSIGTRADIDGNYSFSIPKGNLPGSIVFKSIGYVQQEYPISEREGSFNMSPKLKTESVSIQEVVVSASKKAEKVINAPASVSVLSAERIQNTPAFTAPDQLKKIAGVDIMPTGMVSNNVSVRGFNNIFTGQLLTVVDNRIAGVPSLRFNAFQLIPSSTTDMEKMELVRGPASALYGPNASNGVLAIYTKSPLDQDKRIEGTVSMTTAFRAKVDSINGGTPATDVGSRFLYSPEFRISAKISEKFGVKLSGGYMKGTDFEYWDSREPSNKLMYFGTVKDGGKFIYDSSSTINNFKRDFSIEKFNLDGRMDIRPSKDLTFVVNGGIAQTSNMELTGLGAAQGRNWKYMYGQVRMNWKKLFVQYFINANDAGNTYLIPQSTTDNKLQLLIDKSKLHVFQIQHGADLWSKKLNLIYGADVLLTRPNTEGTINGRFENKDAVNQYGGYVQAELKPVDKFTFVAAARVDYQDVIKEVMISPRAAVLYKPKENQTFRLTYNRAFQAPSSLNYYLDLQNASLPNGVNIRGMGNVSGYNYTYGADGVAQYRSPFDGGYYSVYDKSNNTTHFNALKDSIIGVFKTKVPAPLAPLVGSLIGGLLTGADLSNVDKTVIDLPTYSQTGGNLASSAIDPRTIKDKDAVKSTVTQTFEAGYKGMLTDKLSVFVDAYYTKIYNYVSPLTTSSYSVIYDPTQYMTALTGVVKTNIVPYEGLLANLLDKNVNDPDIKGNNNGTSADEVLSILAKYNAGMNFGTVAPKNAEDNVGSDVILTYVNLGNVDVAGGDVGFAYTPIREMEVTGAFSFTNKNKIPLAGASNGFVALNTPMYKTSLAVNHKICGQGKPTGFGYRANWRWQDAFPANSAVYTGDVRASNMIDLGVFWKPELGGGRTLVALDVNNVLNYKFQRFPGTPYMGRVAMLKLTHTFKSKK